MSMPARAGTDPGTALAAMKDMMAIMARRPLLISLVRLRSMVASLTPEKSIGGKTMVGNCPPFM